MVEAIEGTATDWGVSSLFIAAIIIPIVGNAAEHAAAIIFARRGKMELAMSVAVGSSTQIALFVIPLCVLVAWAEGRDLSLVFGLFETCVLMASVLLQAMLTQEGRSHWLSGCVLLLAYFIIAAAFWEHRDESLDG